MSLLSTEALRLLQSCWPQGAEFHYDLNTGDIRKFLVAQAVLVATGYSAVENLRLELNPATMTEKIPDWEEALGLSQSPIAQFGTTAQRRSQVIATLRSFGSSFSLTDLRAIAQPFLKYQNAQDIEILECTRSALDALHTQTDSTGWLLAAGPPPVRMSTSFTVLDDGAVSLAGARVVVNYTGFMEELDFDLRGPGGFQKIWIPGYLGSGSVTNQDAYLYAPEAAGGPVMGTWTVQVTSSGAHNATINSVSLIVEGIGRDASGNDGLGSAMFTFAIVADPTYLGAGADPEGLWQFLQRIKPAHTTATVVRRTAFGLTAIPDLATTLPDMSVPA